MRITQKLILEPEVETRAYGRDDVARGIGKGLASTEAGLQFRHQIALYVGVSHDWLFNDTKALASTGTETQWMLGIRFWY